MNRPQKNHHEALIALHLIHHLGARRIRLLLQHVDHPAEIFCLSGATLEEVEGIGPAIAKTILAFDDWARVDEIITQSKRTEAQIISFYDDDYPALLRQIYDPPLLLWVKGACSVLSQPGIAVVGTRRATAYGLKMAGKFSGALAGNRLSIVSGLAYGVDAAAHKATLGTGGKTVAVLGSGINRIYPQKNAGLAGAIIKEGGAVITEFLPGTAPDAGNFPVRNRIVSGLTLGTLVIESGLKGGSMITAQSALTQNREVFVVPHSLGNANGEGCNHLIKRGAGKLVQTVSDILEELPQFQEKESVNQPSQSPKPQWKNAALNDDARAICVLLEKEPMHIDDLSEALGESPQILLARLLELELQGCVQQTAGKNFELR